jgi:hypothetical protein
MHLKCFWLEGSHDDLASWTSSLLFALQYAIFRAHTHGRPPSEVYICAVDTRAFAPGQFMRDVPLIETLREAGDEKARGFSTFRLADPRYYNGEYISQGRVNHLGRSSVCTLSQVISSGLFELYPEFEDSEWKNKWANRTLNLRREWAEECDTSAREIALAVKIGRECFSALDGVHGACVLLAFRERRLRGEGNACVEIERGGRDGRISQTKCGGIGML